MPSGLSPGAVDAEGGVKLSSVSVAVSTPADDGKADVKVKIAGDDDAKAVSKDGALDIITHGEDIDGSADRALSGKKERSMKQDFYRILDESKGETGRLAIGAWFLLLTAICNMLVPYFAGRMTDAISLTLRDREADARREANAALYGLLTVGVVGGIFQTARSYLFNTASYKVVARLRNRLFTNILAQEVAFFDSVTSGSLISRLTADTALLKNVATQNLSMALRGLATAVIGLAFMFSTSYKLTLVVIGGVPAADHRRHGAGPPPARAVQADADRARGGHGGGGGLARRHTHCARVRARAGRVHALLPGGG